MCISSRAPHYKQYPSTPVRTGNKPERISQEAIYRGLFARTSSRYHVFQKLLWKPSEDASQRIFLRIERRCFLESNVTPNIKRSSDSFSTVPPIVNMGEWGCIVHDLETIVVLVLLAYNFIPQRSHHSLMRLTSRIRDAAIVTLTPGMAQQPSKWSHQRKRSTYFPEWKKAPKCTGGTIIYQNTAQKSGTPDTT